MCANDTFHFPYYIRPPRQTNLTARRSSTRNRNWTPPQQCSSRPVKRTSHNIIIASSRAVKRVVEGAPSNALWREDHDRAAASDMDDEDPSKMYVRALFRDRH